MHAHTDAHSHKHAEGREQLLWVASLLPPCGSWGSNTDYVLIVSAFTQWAVWEPLIIIFETVSHIAQNWLSLLYGCRWPWTSGTVPTTCCNPGVCGTGHESQDHLHARQSLTNWAASLTTRPIFCCQLFLVLCILCWVFCHFVGMFCNKCFYSPPKTE